MLPPHSAPAAAEPNDHVGASNNGDHLGTLSARAGAPIHNPLHPHAREAVMAASEPLPLAQRIDAAEAYVELVWAKHQAIPAGRGFDSTRVADWERAKHMDSINFMLERLLQFYDERALDGVA